MARAFLLQSHGAGLSAGGPCGAYHTVPEWPWSRSHEGKRRLYCHSLQKILIMSLVPIAFQSVFTSDGRQVTLITGGLPALTKDLFLWAGFSPSIDCRGPVNDRGLGIATCNWKDRCVSSRTCKYIPSGVNFSQSRSVGSSSVCHFACRV